MCPVGTYRRDEFHYVLTSCAILGIWREEVGKSVRGNMGVFENNLKVTLVNLEGEIEVLCEVCREKLETWSVLRY